MRRNGYYQARDIQVPSVTTVLKSAGNSIGFSAWTAKQGGYAVYQAMLLTKNLSVEEVGDISVVGWKSAMGKLAEIGSNAHRGAEEYLKYGRIETSLNDVERKITTTFIKFFKDVGFSPDKVEHQVYVEDGKYRAGGQVDLVLGLSADQLQKLRTYLTKSSDDLPNKAIRIIADLKTGAMYPRAQVVQLGAYTKGLAQTDNMELDGGLLINIKRDTPDEVKCHYFSRAELDRAYEEGFKPAWDCWKYFDAPKWYSEQGEK